LLADALARPLERRAGGEVGAALGAAHLARLARTGEAVDAVCTAPSLVDRFEPDPRRSALLAQRHRRFQSLYAALADRMQPPTSQAS
jgi:xylulokinase